MNVNLNSIKKTVQNGTSHYIAGIKFVTDENAETVIRTIKKDFMIYPNIIRFIIRQNMIDLMLDNNATLYTYYFMEKEVFDEVVAKLEKFNVVKLKL